MDQIRNFLQSKLFYAFSVIICATFVCVSYYLRKNLQFSFLTLYYAGYVFLIISFLIFLCAYKHKDADVRTTIRESLMGYLYFAAFMGITLILRG
ncbi:MAG: hypothetical protein K6A38_01990 [Lachnospiraceae bacterium]|nr:hypothetical protein [Lachnospiraceae bacterium]